MSGSRDADADHACPSGSTVRDALRWATGRLTAADVDSPRLDAELLLGEVLGRTRAGLYTHPEACLDRDAAQRLTALVHRRVAREPLAYLLGRRAFYDLDLLVTPDVLVPRPETELLVEEALAWAEKMPRPLRLVDVGTGSGAIAVTLARHLPRAHVWAVDLSLAAARVARQNAYRAGVAERVLVAQGDLLSPFAVAFDVIAANLPYVARDALPQLMPEVARYEPRLALDGGRAGLDVIERLLVDVPARLASPGLLLIELDPAQVERVLSLVAETLPDAAATVRRDYAGLERIVRVARGGVADDE